MAKAGNVNSKFVPGDDAVGEEIFEFPFITEDDTINSIQQHGRIMFIIRGLPGTGKNSLCDLIQEKYPSSVVCCADLYYRDTFTSDMRDKETLKKSHEYCKKKAQEACRRNEHPIIVKNTHVKRFEFESYLKYAEEYFYTVIMVVSMDKFQITPEILARSNTKGLTVDYFRSRMKGWSQCTPICMGWFLGSSASKCLLGHVQNALDSLLGDGKFCHTMNFYTKETLLNRYAARELLYCISACGKRNWEFEISRHYLSKMVQENYGRSFKIHIVGFLVNSRDILAIIQLNNEMNKLTFQNFQIKPIKQSDEQTGDIDDLISGMDSLFDPVDKYEHGSIPLNSKFINDCEMLENVENINVKSSSLIYLASEDNNNVCIPSDYMEKYLGLLFGIANSNGIIESNENWNELENGYNCYRLPKNTWLVKPSKSILVDTIFSGIFS